MKQEKDFESLALSQLENLYRTALYASGIETDAQAIVQESISRAYYLWHKEQIKPDCRIWLFKNLADAFISKYQPSSGPSTATSNGDKSNGHLKHSWLAGRQAIVHSEEVSLSAISASDIKKAIRNLPDDYRLIVVLSLLEEFSYREIVEIVSLPLEVVRFRLLQGRKLISETFRQCGERRQQPIVRKRSQEEKTFQ
jgi:RNA polymerase sigma-70 factor (ECF subfamily)